MLEPGTPNKVEAIRLLKATLSDIGTINTRWGVAFRSWADLEANRDEVWDDPTNGLATPEFMEDGAMLVKAIATRYFKVCADAIRKHDPNHMILGCRSALVGMEMTPVFESMNGYVDVVSVNDYLQTSDNHRPSDFMFAMIHRANGLPMMVTEFSFRSRDSGLPNTKGAGLIVDTQKTRANAYETYVTGLLAYDFVVGYHWWKYMDEPREGRPDGEDSNYGITTIDDEPYSAFVDTFTRVNERFDVVRLAAPSRP
jgi:hypothetical protein